MTNISSGDIKAKEGDLVNLLCSAQGEPPITFSWEKYQKPLESFMEKDKPHRSSLLTVRMKDQTRFGKYICHIRDRFQSTAHTIWIQELQDTSIFRFLNLKRYACFNNKQINAMYENRDFCARFFVCNDNVDSVFLQCMPLVY